MEPFHFYIEQDESGSNEYDSLLFPLCRDKRGYGIFYWVLKNGKISKIDFMDATTPHSWFENSNATLFNYDDNVGRWGNRKLIPVDDPKYVKVAIQQIFAGEDMYKTMKMWSHT